jgi:hypothetical protein
VLQVLEVLADPESPTSLLAAKLRFVAATATRQWGEEFAAWLDDGLFKHLLDILRRLPDMGLDENEAAEVCAAAAAGISNIVLGATVFITSEQLQISFSPTSDSLRKDASCVKVLMSLVRYGLVNPAATQQLPLGREIYMRVIQGSVPGAVYAQTSCTTCTNREFWTPWRICAVTVFDRLLLGNNMVTAAMAEALAPAVTSTTFEVVLTSIIEHPCGQFTNVTTTAIMLLLLEPLLRSSLH